MDRALALDDADARATDDEARTAADAETTRDDDISRRFLLRFGSIRRARTETCDERGDDDATGVRARVPSAACDR